MGTCGSLPIELSGFPFLSLRRSGRSCQVTIVFIPGFKGFKDWGGWPWFCSMICKAGFRVVSMNPTMCGVGPSLDEFDEPEKFSRQTLTHDLEDLNALFHSEWIPAANPVVLLGHSRGGIVAALGSAREQNRSGSDEVVDLRGVITLGTPHDLMRLSQDELDLWKKLGTGNRQCQNRRGPEAGNLCTGRLHCQYRKLRSCTCTGLQWDPAFGNSRNRRSCGWDRISRPPVRRMFPSTLTSRID